MDFQDQITSSNKSLGWSAAGKIAAAATEANEATIVPRESKALLFPT
jgi:hypothetical protein